MADLYKSRDFKLQRECRVKFVNGVWFPVKSKIEDLNKNNLEQITYSYDGELYERTRSTERGQPAQLDDDFERLGEEFYEVQENEITFDDDDADDDVFLQQPVFKHISPTRAEDVANGKPALTVDTKMGFPQDENNNTTLLPQPELRPKQHETSLPCKDGTEEGDLEDNALHEKETLLSSSSREYFPPEIVVTEISLTSTEGLENCILDQNGGMFGTSKEQGLSLHAPSRPRISSSFPEKAQYIEDGIRWIKCELLEMKKVDRNINSSLASLMASIKQLKKINETFNEQQEILEDLEDIFEKEQFENSHLIDVPLQSREDGRLGLKRKVSNLERYTRLGRDGRRASYY